MKTVVVTGSSGGLGRAIAREFAKKGAAVALLARGKAGLDAAVREIEAMGGKAIALPTDVADADAVEAAAQAVEERLGPIDVWVNNAMASVFSPVREMKPEEYKRATEVTYLGVVYGTLAALKRMGPRKRGTIVQVGSALAYRSIPLQSAYCGAKHAIVGFTDSLRCELIHDKSNIRLTMVQMPAMNTTQFGWVKSRLPDKAQPVPPIYQPEVGARAVVWAASHNRREVYVGIPTVGAIVGNKIAPGLLDRYLGRTGFQSQQTSQKEDPSRPDNLWSPVDGEQDYGAHGHFDNKAHSISVQLLLDLHRWQIVAGLGIAAGAVAALVLASRIGNSHRQVDQATAAA
jgi:NAD(P)-dependent dehydrogenase (short-subunit alcohol dehydrogenase family)